MNLPEITQQMALNARRIAALVEGAAAEQLCWKPDETTWSIQEVLGHLLDEERLDFRVRLELVLDGTGQAWPPIDPPGWVLAHGYAQLDPAETLRAFLAERVASLAWLAGLSAPDWHAAGATPWGGTLRAGELLAAWAAHDVLHLRQLVELEYAFLARLGAPFPLEYAGPW